MSDETEQPESESTAEVSSESGENQSKSIFLVSYPKIVFLYPTAIVSLICAIWMWVGCPFPTAAEGETITVEQLENFRAAAATPARIFLLVLTINTVVISFDFPRTTSLTWFFAVCAAAVGLWTLFRVNEDLAPAVTSMLLSVQPVVSGSFYILFFVALLLLFACVMVSRRFDYWEVRGNELLHHHGILSDLKRFSAPNLRIDKEINDVFEYLLLRSGRLILHPSHERRAIVLENVLFISRKETEITKLLGALQVRFRKEEV